MTIIADHLLIPYPRYTGAFSYLNVPSIATPRRAGLAGLGIISTADGSSVNLSDILGGASIGGISIGQDGSWTVGDTTGGTIASGTSGTVFGCPDPVPIQNAIQRQVLAPVSAAVTPGTSLSSADLQMLYNALMVTQQNWLNFLHQTRCTANADWARRAQGAQSTLQPYFSGLAAKIQYLQSQLGIFAGIVSGAPTIPVVTPYTPPGITPAPVGVMAGGIGSLGGLSWTTLALLAGAAYLLLKK